MNAEIPHDFFADVKDVKPADGPRMSTALRWYDGIIDDILANPGTTVIATAQRLGRSPGTISAITSSDLFKARWEQRRAAFSMALDLHLSSKLATVAEKALDHTIEQLDKKRDSIPLPILKDIALGSLDRLGYGPKSASPATVQVNVNNVGAASPEALARARDRMRELELTSAAQRPSASPREDLRSLDSPAARATVSSAPSTDSESGQSASPPVAGLEVERGERD